MDVPGKIGVLTTSLGPGYSQDAQRAHERDVRAWKQHYSNVIVTTNNVMITITSIIDTSIVMIIELLYCIVVLI